MPRMHRRRFIQNTGGAAASLIVAPAALGEGPGDEGGGGPPGGVRVCLIADPKDPVAASPPGRWALEQLRQALAARGASVLERERAAEAPAGCACVLAAGSASPAAREALSAARMEPPEAPDALALAAARVGERRVALACGSDPRGLSYALLELADRAAYASDPVAALVVERPTVEQPANRVRSVMRLFVSEVEDKPWFNDRAFWERYLSLLAAERFNRFQLAFGTGYDFLNEVSDAYFHFAYPFLLSVPGYKVRAAGLPDDERDRNLEMLRFISDAAAARGLHFQLGLWTHGYDWSRNPGVNYTIEGLTPENHASYCRDALRQLLQGCPAIQGVTFRIHGESGVPEATYPFWKTVFEGVRQCGRRVEIDMHAKGITAEMIDLGLVTGMPVTVAPKFWAEHMGLPYHQAAIRALEMPPKDAHDEGFFALSGGSRRFLRYGYGDLMAEDRRYGVVFRIWPGTQRLLLWGDPAMAAAYSRAASFCGADGLDLFEPLSFKGRKGSGLPGGRDAYADASLKPAGGDFEKYAYTYRLWGRLLYNPDADPETWRRMLRSELGPAAEHAEKALAAASRILPLVTTAHCPSAANNSYWPEMYTNMPLADVSRPHPYGDTPSPKVFTHVSPLDPELFATCDEHAADLLAGRASGKYSPMEVADWLNSLTAAAGSEARSAGSSAGAMPAPLRRWVGDVELQVGLARFFAAKLRAGVFYALYQRGGDRQALQSALRWSQNAREAWSFLVKQEKGLYVSDATFGRAKHLRGHWSDRLAAFDEEIADLERRLAAPAAAPRAHVSQERLDAAIDAARLPLERHFFNLHHPPPASFRRGAPVTIQATIPGAAPATIDLCYRRVNQIDPWRTLTMRLQNDRWQVAIPAELTDTPSPLQYYFELRDARGHIARHPGLGADLCGQPYFVVRQVR